MKAKTFLKAYWGILLGIAIPVAVFAADVAISALGAGSTLAGTEPIPTVQAGVTVKTTPADIGTYMKSTAGTWTATQTLSSPVLNTPTINTPTFGNLGAITPTTISTGTGTFTTAISSGGFSTVKNGGLALSLDVSTPIGIGRNSSIGGVNIYGTSAASDGVGSLNITDSRLGLQSVGVINWTSTANLHTTIDTGLSRISAGVIGVGTGAAGSTAGTISATAVISGLHATSSAAPTITASATIAPSTPILFVTGTTTITSITPPSPISSSGGQITIIPGAVFTVGNSGNVALTTTAVVSKALTYFYDATKAKWYPSY